jgi:small ligand-binding sensory domain FIST
MVAGMGVRIGCGLSTGSDTRVAAIEAGTDARQALGGAPADLVLVFCSGAHLAALDATVEGVREALDPRALCGCGAGGVLSAGREFEGGTAVAVWAAALGGGSADLFHAHAAPGPDGAVVVAGLPDVASASAILLLPDPYSFPADRALAEIGIAAPGTPVLGGLSSARTLDGNAALMLGDDVVTGGAVGVVLRGVEVLPCVSQGAAAIGPSLEITAVDGHVIHELGGTNALAALRTAMENLDEGERALVSGGLLLGVAVGESPWVAGDHDYLVRGIIGADPDAGTVTVGAPVHAGQVVRLHARDAASADRDLREALGLRRAALGRDPAGALVFTCNGRGRGMFGTPDHDADAVDEELGGAPSAGFFAAGEIGPVGGENVLHGFTATVAVFAGE